MITEHQSSASPVSAYPLTPDQVTRLWGWLLHEGNLFNGRQQLFAVAEAMLLAAFASLFAASARDRPSLLAMCIVGVFSSLMWAYANFNQLNRTILPIRSMLRSHLPEWEQVRAQGHGRIRNTTVLGYHLPALVGGLWVYLLLRVLETVR